MLTITLTVGLPASGKSKWAKEQVQSNPQMTRVNKDDLRSLLHAGQYTPKNEKEILAVRDILVRRALERGHHVIVDDTNLHPKHLRRMNEIAMEYETETGRHVQVIENRTFLQVPVEECIRRDALRANGVGESVIRKMEKQAFQGDNRGHGRYEGGYNLQDPSLPRAVLCDLDGTLAIIGDRSPYRGEDCAVDMVNTPVAKIVELLRLSGLSLILISGRNGESEPETRAWLAKNGIAFDHLFMREPGDQRKDSVVKWEIFQEKVRNHFFVEAIFDDRDQVVELWRKDLKMPCFQVYPGDF